MGEIASSFRCAAFLAMTGGLCCAAFLAMTGLRVMGMSLVKVGNLDKAKVVK